MIDPKILRRIKKCLALASSSNEHEAAAALAKARAIMDEHCVSESELLLADVEMKRTRRPTAGARPPEWEVILINLIAGAFAVEAVMMGRDIAFVGLGARPAVATYAFQMVKRIIARQRKDYVSQQLRRCKLATKRVRADYFCAGFVRGIEMEIICLVPEARTCALAKAWVAEHLQVQTIRGRAPQATRSSAVSDDYWRGFDEGMKVKLHHGIHGAETAEPLRLATS